MSMVSKQKMLVLNSFPPFFLKAVPLNHEMLPPKLRVILIISITPVCCLSQTNPEIFLQGDSKLYQVDYQDYSPQLVCMPLQLIFTCTVCQRICGHGEKMFVSQKNCHGTGPSQAFLDKQ